jgi:hypothetical protein
MVDVLRFAITSRLSVAIGYRNLATTASVMTCPRAGGGRELSIDLEPQQRLVAPLPASFNLYRTEGSHEALSLAA